MTDIAKLGLMALFAAPVAGFIMHSDYMVAEMFEAKGEVTEARWNTDNHQMSLFRINSSGSIHELHHYRVTLTPEQIKVGDHFEKISGSLMCSINGYELQCIH